LSPEFPSGNVLDWQASEWTVNGAVENETVTHDEFCQVARNTFVRTSFV
jgi:hypothetical protein